MSIKTLWLTLAIGLVGYSSAQECVATGSKCGGQGYEGVSECCNEGDTCNFWYYFYSECGPAEDTCIPTFGQCGGDNYDGPTHCCGMGEICQVETPQLSRCVTRDLRNSQNDCERYDFANLESPNVNTTGYANQHGKLRVEGTNIVDEQGEIVVLRGVSSAGLHFFPECYADDLYLKEAVENWGITIFRTALYLGEGGYSTDKTLIDDMFRMVDYCIDFGIYCLIDFHQLTPGDPLYYITEPGIQETNATAFWEQVATRYVGVDNVLYDLINEPNQNREDCLAWEEIVVYAQTVIPVIRAIDPDTVMVLSPSEWAQKIFQPYTMPLPDELTHNLVYAFHFYTGTHDRLLYLLEDYGDKIPLLISEWGLSTSSGDAGIYTETATRFLDIADKYNIGHIEWNYADKDETASMLEVGACNASDFTRLSCGGGLAKYLHTMGAFPEEECAISGDQCGGTGTGHVGPRLCCSADDMCIKLNMSYHQCQTPEEVCVYSTLQCGGEGYNGPTTCCNSEDACVAVTDDFHMCEPQIEEIDCDSFEVPTVVSGRGFVDVHGKLQTIDWTLRNSDGDYVQLKGMDAGMIVAASSLEEKQEIAANMVDNWGVNLLSYRLDLTASLEDIEAGIDEMSVICEDLGVYLILSFFMIEQDSPVYFIEEPGINELNATQLWLNVAERYLEKPHLLYEISNRIKGTTNTAEQWEDMFTIMGVITPPIREIDDTRVLIYGLADDGTSLDIPAQRYPVRGTPYLNNVLYGYSFNSATDALSIPKLEMYAEIRNSEVPLMVTNLRFSSENLTSFSVIPSLMSLLNRQKYSYVITEYDNSLSQSSCVLKAAQSVVASDLVSAKVSAANLVEHAFSLLVSLAVGGMRL